MKQIDYLEPVKEIGGIKSSYYSICQEVLLKGNTSKLSEYIVQDHNSFLLNEVSLNRMDNLCHFSVIGRDGAPMKKPTEWRNFDKILKEENEERRKLMLEDVEKNKLLPSVVWAEREAELHKPRWETWLRDVSLTLNNVKFSDDLESDEAKNVGQRLETLIDQLENIKGDN
jgi:hypothetical protein